MKTQRFLALALTAALGLGACGLKADPRPPAAVQPEPIVDLSGEITKDGIRLKWSRPDSTADGERMDDLGGFLIFRGRPGELAEELADVPVLDRERFRREKTFEYVDASVEKGQSYYYRVIAHTTDSYYSAPSNQVSVTVEP